MNTKKIFQQNNLKRKFFRANINIKIIVQIYINAHINTDKLMHKDTFYRHILTHTHVMTKEY